MIEATTPERALAVFAHPDDPEVGCGGTLARWAALGAEVHLVIANRGDKGSFDPDTDPDALADHRAEEVTRAAAVLGLAGVEHLGYPDGEIDNGAVLRAPHRDRAPARPRRADRAGPDGGVLRRQLRQPPRPPRARLGRARHAGTRRQPYAPEAGPAHQVGLVLLSGTLEADAWVDIGAVLDKKVAAVACHKSRLGGDPALVAELLEHRAAEEGRRAGVPHAEPFRRLRFTG